jgi:hypothetical protein
MNKAKKFIILGASILFVALVIFLIVFTLNKSKNNEPKEDWIREVAWYGQDSYQIYEENGKNVIYHPDSGFKFFIPTNWNWNVSLGNYWAYTESPNTVFKDSTSLLTGCYVLVSAFVGEDFYSRITEKIKQVRESPESTLEIIKVAGAEGLYSKYPEGFNFSIINIPFNQEAILRIKVFYPLETEEREKCNNAFLEIINKAEKV